MIPVPDGKEVDPDGYTTMEKMRYQCLIFDHDDTTVNSTAKIHYPCFVEYMKTHRPEISCTLDEYVSYNFHPGVQKFFSEICGLSEEELIDEQAYWYQYAKSHTADAFAGIREIMEQHRAQGGIIAVVSHSYAENIMKDYRHNELPLPDVIFGWEQPPEERKPAPVPVLRIMERYHLKPEEVLVIDDLKPGLDMARAAGVHFAAACWCFDIPENEAYMRANADYFCKRVSDLERILL